MSDSDEDRRSVTDVASSVSEEHPDRENDRSKRARCANNYFRGVYRCGKRWKAQIHFDSSQHYLGTFETPEEAAKAYDGAARIHHGLKAKTNYTNEGKLSNTIKGRRKRPFRKPSGKSYRKQMSFAFLANSPQSVSSIPVGLEMDSGGSSPRSTSLSGSQSSCQHDDIHARIQLLQRLKLNFERQLYGPEYFTLTCEQRQELADEVVVLTIQEADLLEKLYQTAAQQATQFCGGGDFPRRLSYPKTTEKFSAGLVAQL